LRQLGDVRLGPEIPYLEFQSLSVEARQKLAALAPATMAQAAGIPGVNPVDLQNLIIELEKRRRAPAGRAT
jgi:tRNA uridine 5-carboxymethylaminomethyl modification enzyme